MKGAAAMLREKRSIVINRPVDEVFAYVTDPRNNATWNAWIIETVMRDDEPLAVGSEFDTVAAFLGRRIESHAVITELVPNQRGSIRTTTGPVVATGSRIVEPVPGGTRFTQTLEADVRGAFRGFGEAFVIKAFVRQLEADLQTLKELLESGVAVSPEHADMVESAPAG
jgi:uncharacterized membrane protein